MPCALLLWSKITLVGLTGAYFSHSPLCGAEPFSQTACMADRWPSRLWSCSEILRGAAQVVDSMALPDVDLQNLTNSAVSATDGLDPQQLEALLEVLLVFALVLGAEKASFPFSH